MVDKRLKTKIKNTKDFVTLWLKFHNLYKDATKKGAITQEQEDLFLDTKSLITDRYKDLRDSLSLDSSNRDETMDVVSHVLSLKSMAAISDEAFRKIEESWQHSYTFLNNILNDLKSKDEELARKRSVFEFSKRIFDKKAVQIILLVFVVFILAYILNVIIGLFSQ